jgi:hypothetical protein
LCLLSVLSYGCGEQFAPASRLTNLRLLAVAADPPAAAPGEEVKLNALYHDRLARPLEWGYAYCDAQTSSAALDCARSIDVASLMVATDTPEQVFVMPELTGDNVRATALGVAVIVCPGHIVPGDTQGIPIACEVDGKPLDLNDFEIGIKRVFYRAQQSENANPQIAQIRWDGATWEEGDVKQVEACAHDTDDVTKCDARTRHQLSVEAPDAAEEYVDPQGESAREQAVVQFYANGGSFEYDARTPENATTRWVARRADAGKTLRLFFVVRDSRGGVSWVTRSVEVLDASGAASEQT